MHQEAFSSDYELQGLFAVCDQNFQTGDWDIHEVKLTLYYTATMLVREEISDFTVSVNGQPVFSGRIPLTGGETQKLDISIPFTCIKKRKQPDINRIIHTDK
ncbi:MAG: cellulose biosynthesis cyclic di-GMP-binding regulatory protein BcsB [Eisenbergiella massiliensis]